MVVRIHNVGKWACLPAGKVLELPVPAGEPAPRKIRLEVNCVAPTRFDVHEVRPGYEPSATFLAVVVGHEILEFVATGEVHIVPSSDDDVWFFTNDGDQPAVDVPGAVSFTKIMNRRSRNPQLELMMFKTEQRMNARFEQQAAELAALHARREGADPVTGELPNEDGSAAADGDTGGAAVPATGGAVAPAVEGEAGGAAATA